MMLHICLNRIMWLSFIWWIKRTESYREEAWQLKSTLMSLLYGILTPQQETDLSPVIQCSRGTLKKSHSDSISVSSAWKLIYLSMRLIYSSCCLLSPWLLVCKRAGFVKRSFFKMYLNSVDLWTFATPPPCVQDGPWQVLRQHCSLILAQRSEKLSA